MDNLFKDKLYSMISSNALLLLPESKDGWKLSKLEIIPALLVDYPGKFNRLLPEHSNEIDKIIKRNQ